MVELLRPPPPEPPRERLARHVKAALQRFRPATAPRLLLAAGGAVVVVVLAVWLLRTPPPPVEASLPFATTSAPTAGAASASGPTGTIVVQAAGEVASPGVYHLPEGSRVVDLLAAAGGPTAGADPGALALAAVLVDGARVQVPRVGEVLPASPSVEGPAGPLDVNTATAEQLDELPGVGPSLAAAIVRTRERQGPFPTVDSLLEVPGIGPAKLDALRELVTA